MPHCFLTLILWRGDGPFYTGTIGCAESKCAVLICVFISSLNKLSIASPKTDHLRGQAEPCLVFAWKYLPTITIQQLLCCSCVWDTSPCCKSMAPVLNSLTCCLSTIIKKSNEGLEGNAPQGYLFEDIRMQNKIICWKRTLDNNSHYKITDIHIQHTFFLMSKKLCGTWGKMC